jgi:hypothetical protein
VQAQALDQADIMLSDPSPGTITLNDTAAAIQGLQASDIGDFRELGFNAIVAKAGPLALRIDQSLAAVQDDDDGNSPMSVSAPGGVTVTDTEEDFANATLDGDDISALKTAGFSGFISTDGSLYFSVAAALAIDTAKMTVSASNGDVIIDDDAAASTAP